MRPAAELKLLRALTDPLVITSVEHECVLSHLRHLFRLYLVQGIVLAQGRIESAKKNTFCLKERSKRTNQSQNRPVVNVPWQKIMEGAVSNFGVRGRVNHTGKLLCEA